MRLVKNKQLPFYSSMLSNWRFIALGSLGAIFILQHMMKNQTSSSFNASSVRKGIMMETVVAKRPFAMPLVGDK
jgi:Na+/proline symporter